MGASQRKERCGVRHADRYHHAELGRMPTQQYKQFKGLRTESLRDNMINLELGLNMLAEASTTEISKQKKPRTVAQNRKVAAEGDSVAAAVRKNRKAGRISIECERIETVTRE